MEEFCIHFTDAMNPCLATTDEEFAAAAITNMSAEQPAFKSHAKHRMGHLFEFDESNWDGVDSKEELREFFAFFGLPMPRDFSMFRTAMRRKDLKFTLCVELVPKLMSVDDVVNAVECCVGGETFSRWETELDPQIVEPFGLLNTEGVRNVYVDIASCDARSLGQVLTVGLPIFGLNFRARRVICVPPFDIRHERPSLPPQRPACTHRASQTDAPPRLTSRDVQTTPSEPSQQPAGRSTPRRRRRRSPHTQPEPRTPPPTPRHPPPQCFKCMDYGHVSADCKGPVRCRKCAGSHQASSCESESRCCAVCMGHGRPSAHAASARGCPYRPLTPPSSARKPHRLDYSPKRPAQQRIRSLLSAILDFLS